MYTAIVVFIVLISILLSLVVLVQNSKGGGLAAGFSSSQQIMGVRKTTDFLEKFTWGLAVSLMVLALVGNFALPKNQEIQSSSTIQEQIDNASLPAAPSAPLPGGQQQQPANQQQPPPAK